MAALSGLGVPMHVLACTAILFCVLAAAPAHAAGVLSSYAPAPNYASFNLKVVNGIPAQVDRVPANVGSDVHFSFTVAPSHSVVENQPVELRANIYTSGSQPVGVNLNFYAGPYQLAQPSLWQILEPGKQYLVTFWYVPQFAGFLGKMFFYGFAQKSATEWSSIPWPVHVFSAQTVPAVGGSANTNAFPAAQVAWLEPGSLFPSFPQRAGGSVITGVAFDTYLERLHRRGVRTLVLSNVDYKMYNGATCIYYAGNSVTGLPFCGGYPFDVVARVLSKASALRMKVILGLGTAGKKSWTLDVASYYAANPSVWPNLSSSLAADKNFILARQLQHAQELWRNYGKNNAAFYGFYLPHESNCHDHATTHLYNPMAAELRKLVGADKIVMISPPLLAKACSSGQTLKALLQATDADVVAYQDGVGAGSQIHLGADGVRSNDDFSLPYSFNPMATFAAYVGNYSYLMVEHEKTGRHVWANAEFWRMPGSAYSQVGSTAAPFWQARAQLQYASFFVGQIMLNESLYYFYDPTVAGFTLADQNAANSVSNLWNEYATGLDPTFGTPLFQSLP